MKREIEERHEETSKDDRLTRLLRETQALNPKRRFAHLQASTETSTLWQTYDEAIDRFVLRKERLPCHKGVFVLFLKASLKKWIAHRVRSKSTERGGPSDWIVDAVISKIDEIPLNLAVNVLNACDLPLTDEMASKYRRLIESWCRTKRAGEIRATKALIKYVPLRPLRNEKDFALSETAVRWFASDSEMVNHVVSFVKKSSAKYKLARVLIDQLQKYGDMRRAANVIKTFRLNPDEYPAVKRSCEMQTL